MPLNKNHCLFLIPKTYIPKKPAMIEIINAINSLGVVFFVTISLYVVNSLLLLLCFV